MIILSIRPCGTSRVLLHAVKCYDMGPSRFTSHPRGRCAADFYRPNFGYRVSIFLFTVVFSNTSASVYFRKIWIMPKVTLCFAQPVDKNVIVITLRLSFDSGQLCGDNGFCIKLSSSE
jgi:hypothetical protein